MEPSFYLVDDFDEDDDLGHYESEEDFDDRYFNEDEQQITVNPTKLLYSNIQNMKLPIDMIKEILIHSTLPTFVKLCHSSKEVQKLCTNDLWQLKFNQNQLGIKHNPQNYNDWIKLYHYYFILEKKVNHYLMWMLLKETCGDILLEKDLSNEQMVDLLNNIDAHSIRLEYRHDPFKRRFNKTIYISRDWSHLTLEVITIEHSYIVTELQLKEFIRELFYYGYLDENKFYYNC